MIEARWVACEKIWGLGREKSRSVCHRGSVFCRVGAEWRYVSSFHSSGSHCSFELGFFLKFFGFSYSRWCQSCDYFQLIFPCFVPLIFLSIWFFYSWMSSFFYSHLLSPGWFLLYLGSYCLLFYLEQYLMFFCQSAFRYAFVEHFSQSDLSQFSYSLYRLIFKLHKLIDGVCLYVLSAFFNLVCHSLWIGLCHILAI